MAALRLFCPVSVRVMLIGVSVLLLAFTWLVPTYAQDEQPAPPKVIYLTFDDGPSGYTQAILDILARYNAKATFFVVGRQAAGNLPLLQAMVDAGHGVANHTYHHPMLTSLSLSRVDDELISTGGVLGSLDHGCLRPPYGAANKTVRAEAEALGYTVVMWTIDPRDWARPGAGAIANHVIQRAKPNAIILLHDGGGDRTQTVAALDTIVSTLSQQGYTFAALCRDGAPKTPPPPVATAPAAPVAAATLAGLVDGAPAPEVLDLPNRITSPKDGATVHGQVSVSGIATHPSFRKWQLDLLLDGVNETFLALGEQPVLEDSELFTLDTTLYPDGDHVLRLRVVRDALNYDEYFAKVTIANAKAK